LTSRNTLSIEQHPKQVQIVFEGQVIADTHQSLLLIESYAPDIYIPFEDIDMSCMEKTQTKIPCSTKGDAEYWTIQVNDAVATDAMWAYASPHASCSAIAGHAAFKFDQVDTFVNGQLVRGHVRDPNKTIKTEHCTSHLQMEIVGEIVVDSRSWFKLYETGLPVRYYVPSADIKSDFLVPSTRQSVCTYKGEALYHHIQSGDGLLENVVWCYPEPWLDFSEDVRHIGGFSGTG